MTNLPYPYLDPAHYPTVDPEMIRAIQADLDALALDTNSLTARSWPGTVTTLPTSPTNAQEVFYVADSTNGVVWHLKYRSASVSTYKWEYVGGPPMRNQVDTDSGTTSTTYTTLATAGPTVTVPLTGEYVVRFGCNVYNGTAGNSCLHSIDVGGGAVDADSASTYVDTLNQGAAVMACRSKTPLPASTAIVSKYRTSGGTGQFRWRWMEVTPVRLG